MTPGDLERMARALALAQRGLGTTDPNPQVGCVLTQDGEPVGEGWHEYAGGPHAEVNALAAAGGRAKGATCYVTLEPCAHTGRTPPCVDALIRAQVARVVVAMVDPNPLVSGQGIRRLREAGIQVDVGVLADAAAALNPGFVTRMREGRPFVRVKLAASLDGRSAMASGESRWITGEEARADVHRFRARASAILSGVGTVLRDDPLLTVRPAPKRRPLRVIADSHFRTPPSAALFREAGPVLVVGAHPDACVQATLAEAGAETLALPPHAGRVPLGALLASLAARGVNEVWTECGATLAGALVQEGLVDEIVLYLAPMLLGDTGRGLFHLPGLTRLAEAQRLQILDIRPVGADWRITGRPVMGATGA